MAFDKLVDSVGLDAGLTSIADAIREKAGTSDSLAFPTGFAEAIAAISAGGGDAPDLWGNSTFDSGSFTITPVVQPNFTVEHRLGRTPVGALIFFTGKSAYGRSDNTLLFAVCYSTYSGPRIASFTGKTSNPEDVRYNVSSLSITNDSDFNVLSYYTNCIYKATDSQISFGDPTAEKTRFLLVNEPYYWIVW